ncbi:hypothetical protein [Methylomonas albis]|nr:hypothetical protein [Methylomonas albis]
MYPNQAIFRSLRLRSANDIVGIAGTNFLKKSPWLKQLRNFGLKKANASQ